MDLRYLRYFIAVADEMSLTRAAERLNTVQPSLSRQIRRLEEIVGTPLFNHDRRGLELTEAGQLFLVEARKILRQMNRSIMLARQGARTESRQVAVGFIAGTETMIFSKLLPALRRRAPETQLAYHAMTESELVAALQEPEIDVAFLAGPIDEPELSSELFSRQKMVVVLPPDHPLAKHRKISPADLASMPMVHPSSKANPRYLNWVNSVAESAGVHFSTTIEQDNVVSSLHAVARGLGFSLLPDYQRDILPRSVVARQLDIEPQPSFDLVMAYHKNCRNLVLADFLRIIREEIVNEPQAV